jgi:hypothetical protein
MTDKLTLADVDGTVMGRAALVIINLDDPWGEKPHSMMRQDLDEEGFSNPRRSCWNVWETTKADWPSHTVTVVANPRADYLDWVVKMEHLGIEDNTPERYLECLDSPWSRS